MVFDFNKHLLHTLFLDLYTGRVFIFSKYSGRNDTWVLASTLDSPVIQIGQGFGFSVAISGYFAVVGSTNNNGNVILLPYHYYLVIVIIEAFVFYRNASSKWDLSQHLTPNTDDPFSRFGFSVAIYESLMAIGAYGDG